ncbi:MAG: cytochrome c oxidase accessory protein CcoG [Oceanospirillaceae bacterium]|nr:cytochrome c oxidase accessory protein CcoG [Oceanospirillaceae bacterium]MBT12854.1 cytochrome c oxidase accessory protein CcoG [Oceanospirillaceae bacterium]|tara:strand:- start:81124 stop:82494 length:1371 start_codon:yes stop_codon:yes gene_type:complete
MESIPVVQLDPNHAEQTNATIVTGHAQVNGKFYVRLTHGVYQNLRRSISWPLITLFFAAVWIPWGDHPLVLFSFSERRIFLGPLQLSWYDLPLLAGLLITGAALLFFMAVAWGRVWCGFACPQSIWSWIFIRIEDWTEGSAGQRRRQDTRGLSASQWARRISKHLLWLLVALATALTFTGYFVPMRTLLPELAQWHIASAVWMWVLTMAALTYLNAGLVREKICQHACPYSRFQSVMFDADTRTVSYDRRRGEPRSAQGDCVDCTLCVQVCPAGIDIRNGLQLACIDCGACIDACDKVMNKIGKATGLIRFASEHQLSGNASPLIRPKLLSYLLAVVIGATAVGWGFSQSSGLLVEVARQRGQLYTERPDNTVCNDIRIKAEGLIADEHLVKVAVSRPDFELAGPGNIDLQALAGQWLNYRVCADHTEQPATPLVFTFSLGDEVVEKPFKFLTYHR